MKFGRRVVLIAVSVLICLGCVSYMPQKSAAQAANQFVVFINPGHGNSRTGSGNVTKGVKESLINEQVAVKLYNELTAAGVKVYSTNPIEIAPSIPTIIKGDPKKTNSYHGVQYEFATELLPAINTPWVFDASVTKKPDLVISIHHNSYGTYPNAANGYEVYYSSQVPAGGDYDWYGKDAKTAQGSKDIAGLIDSQFRSGGYAYAPRVPSVKDDLKVNSITRYSGVPSVLVEVGFMSNANDFANMRNDAIQQDTAKRIAKAAIEYKRKHNDITPPVMTSLQTSSTKTQSPFFSLKVGAKDDQSGVDQVLFYVWNRTLGTDKMKTYIGTPAGDGTWSCTFNAVTDFQNQNGIYDVHIYATDKAGNKGFFTGVTYEMLPDILPPTAKGANATGYAAKGAQFHAAALGVSDGAGVAKVEFAVWNQTGDLKWYNAQDYHDGNWGTVIDIKNHQNREGIYQIHAYATDYRGNRGFIASTTYNAFIDNDPPTMKDMSVTKYDNNYRLFHAAALSVKDKSRIKSVEFAVWNQPDDIKWYSGADYKDGNWGALVNIANHKNRQGNYTIHVYGTDMWDNRGLMGTATYRAEKVSVPPTTSGVNVTPFSENGKDFHAAVLNVASKAGIAKVEFAVWNQPDDLKWYNGTDYKDGDWGALVNIAEHKNREGAYTIHTYVTDKNGDKWIVGSASYNVKKKAPVPPTTSGVNVTPFSENGKDFHAAVLNVASKAGIAKVEFAVWNQPDDLKWYNGTDYKDGDWGALVNIAEHKNREGAYTIHTYVTDKNGDKWIVGSALYDVKIDKTLPTADGVSAAIYNEKDKSVFHAAALNVKDKSGIAKVEFAVWNQPDDLKWYNGTDYKDGNWGALVSTKDHLNRTGTYTIHAYATDKSGNRGIVGATTFIAEKSSAVPAAKSAVAEAYNGDGNILYAKVLGVTSPLPIQKVEFAVWNDSAKYPTVKWYTADDYLDGNYGKLVYISDFGGEGGKYCVHTYVTDATGQKSVVGTSEALMVGNGYTIMGANQLTAQQLVNYYKSRAVFPTFYAAYGITIESFCQAYIDECVIEGIRPEVAFAQMCLETNYLKYTGDVKIEQFNFGGIGATGNGNPGNSFASAQIGIRAQVQHLKAYASTDLLVNPCVDPRFQYVQRGCAPTVELLSRKWATSDTYGKKILVMIEGILNTPKAAMENLVLPSATPSVTPKPSASATPSVTPKPSASATPSVTPKPSASATPSVIPTPSASATPTPSASATPTPSASATPTPSASVTPSVTPTSSATSNVDA